MANFSPSNLVKAQVLLNQQYTSKEMREQTLPALRMALSNANVLIPSAEQVRTREDRSVEAYVLSRASRTPGTSRTHNHTGSRGDSFAVPLTWGTYSDKFSISLKQMDNNMFGFEQTLAQQMLNCILNIHAQIEADDISYLLAQKSQVNAGSGYGSFNATNDVFEIAATEKNRFVAISKIMMQQNKYNGVYDMILDPKTYADSQFYGNQGAGNGVNTLYQYAGVNSALSINLSDSNYEGGAALIMPTASFANIPWIPKQNRNGYGDYNSYVGGYGSFQDPTGLGLTYAVHGYSSRTDSSASNGDTQDVTMEFEISVDIAKVLAPLSATASTNESVVFEIGQLS